MGPSASGDGQWQNWEADARFGDRGWEPSSAVQAALLQGEVNVMSSFIWKSLMGTQNKKVFTMRRLFTMFCNKNKLVPNFVV